VGGNLPATSWSPQLEFTPPVGRRELNVPLRWTPGAFQH
jgi:hypothetical protein